MRQIYSPVTALLLGCVLVSSQAMAGDVALHGFIRSALDISNSKAPYLESIDDKGDFGGSFAGLNYSTVVNSQWQVAGQLFFMAKEGEMEMDWAFATFRPNDVLAVRFGRQKYPLGVVTETENVDVGLTYPWARPPAEFYQLEMGDESPNFVVENFDGVSLDYTGGDDWEFSLQPFIGQHHNADNSLRQMLGLKMQTSNDIATLQAGYVSSKMTILGELDEQTKTTANVGARVEVDDFLVYVEYADTKVADSDEFDAKGGYAAVGYRMGKFMPSVTYATVEGQEGALDQTSTTLALAYSYNHNTVFKAQWKHIKPGDTETEGLIDELPEGDSDADVVSFAMDLVF